MASPPKPWERNGAAGTATPMATTSTTGTAPAVPPVPSSLTSSVNQNAAAYSRPGSLGAIGGMSGMSGMGSPYSSYGAGYSPYRYGSMGGYGGGMYGGGYGSSMYGGGMYSGGGMYGAGGGMYGNDPNSLTNRFNTSTQATFQMLEGIVGAFGGFAQMLESTYMATHSSFYAMISVAEQFGNLRDALGSVLGIFTLLRWIRTLLAKLTGRPLPADAMALTPAAFAKFEGRAAPPGADANTPKPSRKPLFFFVLAAFGLPFLMNKAIKALAANSEEEERRQMLVQQQQQQQQQGPIDMAALDFCRVLYDYTPDPALVAQHPGTPAGPSFDMAVKRDDLIVVLAKTDPAGQASDWWQCRTRDGRIGYLPSTYLKVMDKAKKATTARIMPAPPAAPSETDSAVAAATAPGSPDPVLAEKAAAQKAANVDAFMKAVPYQS